MYIGKLNQASDRAKAIEFWKQSLPVAIPTETVYGLAAPIFDQLAVQRIFEYKKRPLQDPLIAHIGSLEQATQLCTDWPKDWQILAEHFWPGPLTMVCPKRSTVPDLVTSGQNTIALRMPASKLLRELILQLGQPLVAPSANRFGRISPTCIEHVSAELADCLQMGLDDGACSVGLESTIIAQHENGNSIILLRPGAISAGEISRVLNKPVVSKADLPAEPTASVSATLQPGQFLYHYAPRNFFWYLESGLDNMDLEKTRPDKTRPEKTAWIDFICQQIKNENIHFLAWNLAQKIYLENLIQEGVFSNTQTKLFLAEEKGQEGVQEASKNFYSLLRQMDQKRPENENFILLALPLPLAWQKEHSGLYAALLDRLQKSASGFISVLPEFKVRIKPAALS